MAILDNKWIQKQKVKQKPETVASYEKITSDSWEPVKTNKPIKRHSLALHANMHKTLNGVRK